MAGRRLYSYHFSSFSDPFFGSVCSGEPDIQLPRARMKPEHGEPESLRKPESNEPNVPWKRDKCLEVLAKGCVVSIRGRRKKVWFRGDSRPIRSLTRDL